MMLRACIVAAFAVASVRGKPEPAPYNPIPINNVESAVLSISERLRTWDSFIFSSQKWDLTLSSHSRKLEILESKISRLEPFLDLKIDILADAYQSKAVKEELARDQLSGKIDKVYERLNHRMSYMESRIESSIGKHKSALNATLSVITQQLESLEKSNSELDAEMVEMSSNIDDVKSMLLSLNASLGSPEQSSPGANHDAVKKMESIGEQFNNFATKVSNIFHETALKIKSNEDVLRSVVEAFTTVKKEMQEANHNLKGLKKQACPTEDLEFLIDKVENMARENEATYERLDNNVERLHRRQELFQSNCLRIQADEVQIENRIGHTLDKILDSIDNRTLVTDRNYDAILERLKPHNYARAMGQCTNSVLKLKDQLAQDLKTLAHDVTFNNPGHGKIDFVIDNLKLLQEQFHRLAASLTCDNNTGGMSQEVLNTTALILSQMQQLNDSINTVIDKFDQEHRTLSEWPDTLSDDSDKATRKILDIFNVPEAELSAKLDSILDVNNYTTVGDSDRNADEEDKAGEDVHSPARADDDGDGGP